MTRTATETVRGTPGIIVNDSVAGVGIVPGVVLIDPTTGLPVDVSASVVGMVPSTRTVAGHALSADVTLAQADIGGLTTADSPTFAGAQFGAIGNASGGYVVFPEGQGVNFFTSTGGPLYGAGKFGMNYRSISGESIPLALLQRGAAYIWENDGATWLMSLTSAGLNIGSQAGAAAPNVLSQLEVNGGVAVGAANCRLIAAPANGLRVQGKVQFGTTGDNDFGPLTVGHTGALDYALLVGDIITPTNTSGIAIRATGQAKFVSWAPISFYTNATNDEQVRMLWPGATADYITLSGGVAGTPGTVTIGTAGTDTNINITLTPKGTGTVKSATSLTATTGFGCNSKTAQTAVTVNAACTDLSTAVALINQLRAALVANGICA